MNIVTTQYTLEYKALEIYISGCDGACKGCHNPELQSYNLGVPYQNKMAEINEKIETFDNMIDSIWILGGEPLLQNHIELSDMIRRLKSTGKEIWLWTRFEINQIPRNIIELCDYIKVSNFVKSLETEDNTQYGIKLATSNQKIINIQNYLMEK